MRRQFKNGGIKYRLKLQKNECHQLSHAKTGSVTLHPVSRLTLCEARTFPAHESHLFRIDNTAGSSRGHYRVSVFLGREIFSYKRHLCIDNTMYHSREMKGNVHYRELFYLRSCKSNIGKKSPFGEKNDI